MARRLEIQKAKPAPPTFPLFGLLPLELRNSIWLHALPGPRIVEIFLDADAATSSSSSSSTSAPAARIARAVSPTHTPSILHVTHESRREARRTYAALDLGPDIPIPGAIHVDFRRDTLYLSRIRGPSGSPLPDPRAAVGPRRPHCHNLQRLAIDASVWSHLDLTFLKTACPSLRSLTITVEKASLADLKPASPGETVRLMRARDYFTHPAARRVFAADWDIPRRVRAALDEALRTVASAFHPYQSELVLDQQTERHLGVLKAEEEAEEEEEAEVPADAPAPLAAFPKCQLVFRGRRCVELVFGLALYPRESKFDHLKPSLDVALRSVSLSR